MNHKNTVFTWDSLFQQRLCKVNRAYQVKVHIDACNDEKFLDTTPLESYFVGIQKQLKLLMPDHWQATACEYLIIPSGHLKDARFYARTGILVRGRKLCLIDLECVREALERAKTYVAA